MATVIRIDFTRFATQMEQIMGLLRNNDLSLRPIAIELTGKMSQRIHEDGLASDGSAIGSYKTSYLRIREQHKHSPTDTKAILVLTRKLSNSWRAFATDAGWAVGYIEEADAEGVTSLKKIKYAEEHFAKKIGELTKEEDDYVNKRLPELIEDILENL